MKRAILMFLTFSLCGLAWATDVSGPVHGIWDYLGSPYNVWGDIWVPPDSTLIINPRVEILFRGHYKFMVQQNATLKAHGGPGLDSIRFTPYYSTGTWWGLRFTNAADMCSLAYCVLEKGSATTSPDAGGGAISCDYSNPKIYYCDIRLSTATGSGGGIRCNYSNPHIWGCIIRSNAANSGDGGGIACFNSSPIITSCKIKLNTAAWGGGICMETNSNPVISNCDSISGNTALNTASGIGSWNSNPTIHNNIISGNFTNSSGGGGGGIYLEASGYTITDNKISGNTGRGLGGGICSRSSNGLISGNNIAGNQTIGWSDWIRGGGIFCDYSDSVTITDNIISGNWLTGGWGSRGGGISLEHADPVISNNTITGNSANNHGGGISCIDASPQISDNVISGNTTPTTASNSCGGGISCMSSSYPSITGNTIVGNSTRYGGGIDCENSSPTITNNNIRNNIAGNVGGGIYCYLASPTIYDNVLWENTAVTRGGGMFCENNSQPKIDLNLIGKNTVTATDSKGGGIYLENYTSTDSLVKNTIYGNVAVQQGGGIYALNSNPYLNSCIIWGNTAGEGAQMYPSGSSALTVRYSCIQDGWFGLENISTYPAFLDSAWDDTRLLWGSPCIDAGDTAVVYNDPDGTRADMGCFYFNQNLNVQTFLTPHEAPIEIPAAGGSFNYTIWAMNIDLIPHATTVWCNVTLPSGATYGPVLGPMNFTLPANFVGSRARTQNVPASAPVGQYSFNALAVANGDTVSDSFTFTKLAVSGNDGISGWANWGESFDDLLTIPEGALIPHEYSLKQNFPNPFNPTTVISYQLSDFSHVSLKVYDTAGRLITTLVEGWRTAGTHEATFDGSSLASGLYLAKLQAGEFTATQRMVLLK